MSAAGFPLSAMPLKVRSEAALMPDARKANSLGLLE
jgi:hypothetical protein